MVATLVLWFIDMTQLVLVLMERFESPEAG